MLRYLRNWVSVSCKCSRMAIWRRQSSDFAAERGAGIPARGQTRVDAAVAVERAGERGLDALRVEVGGEAEVGIADHVAARVRTQAQAAVGRGDGHVALPGVAHRTQPAVDRDLRSEEHTSELQSLM